MEAAECHAIGLIHYLVEPQHVMNKTREVAEMMAAKPAIAMRLTKARFRQVTQAAFDEAFENGGAYQAEAFASGEPQAAMRVFFTERAARRKAREAGGKS
jgi:enoyl-CoA hydratase/carnithine racemase